MIGLVNYSKDAGSVELRELPVPEIGEEDVLFSVQAVGVCGSDLHQYMGTQSWPVNFPVVLGHEFAGIVAKSGSRVSGFKDGDRVVISTEGNVLTFNGKAPQTAEIAQFETPVPRRKLN